MFPTDDRYIALLSDLKTRIQRAQIRAVLAVNQEMIILYWQIGRVILEQQQEQGWGAKVIDRLAQDLKREFPGVQGFSSRNLKYMRALAEAYPDEEIVLQTVAQIPWGHNQALLNKLKDRRQRIWYAQKAFENGWSRDVLSMQIESDLYQRQGGATTNFDQTLPQPQSDLAQQLFKSPYNLDFLTLAEGAQERDLENALVAHIRDFLLELGVGFAFVGNQYPIVVDDKEYRIDLLFYHFVLRCFVVIELKMRDFEPEFAGKMNFYVSAVDDLLRHQDDNPTIGIILCRFKGKMTVEYALRDLKKPIGVSTHQLPKRLQDKLPTVEQLEVELEAAVSELDALQEEE
nr:PDDEXK nuclease domain-containing protein [Pseudanabaena sp. FACHB-2040]